jgi:hexosaminidase
MNWSTLLLFLSLSCCFTGCVRRIEATPLAGPLMTQTQLDEFAQHLQVRYRVITNEPSEQCLPKESDGQCVTLALSLTSPIAFHHKQWQVYFSHINPIQSDDSDDFEITHLNGDLHRLVPTKQFKGFEANDTYTIRFRANYWSLSEYDALPNYIIGNTP